MNAVPRLLGTSYSVAQQFDWCLLGLTSKQLKEQHYCKETISRKSLICNLLNVNDYAWMTGKNKLPNIVLLVCGAGEAWEYYTN